MKLKIVLNDSEKEIEIKGLKGKHKKNFIKKITEISKLAKEDSMTAVGQMTEFLDYQDDLNLELINLTKEEYEDLDLEEQNKITLAIRHIMFPGEEGKNIFF